MKIDPNFSDAKQGKVEESQRLFKEAREARELGYTINEDNTVYETYPYQIKRN